MFRCTCTQQKSADVQALGFKKTPHMQHIAVSGLSGVEQLVFEDVPSMCSISVADCKALRHIHVSAAAHASATGTELHSIAVVRCERLQPRFDADTGEARKFCQLNCHPGRSVKAAPESCPHELAAGAWSDEQTECAFESATQGSAGFAEGSAGGLCIVGFVRLHLLNIWRQYAWGCEQSPDTSDRSTKELMKQLSKATRSTHRWLAMEPLRIQRLRLSGLVLATAGVAMAEVHSLQTASIEHCVGEPILALHGHSDASHTCNMEAMPMLHMKTAQLLNACCQPSELCGDLQRLHINSVANLQVLCLCGCPGLSDIELQACSKLQVIALRDCEELEHMHLTACQAVEVVHCEFCGQLEEVLLRDCHSLRSAAFLRCTSLRDVQLGSFEPDSRDQAHTTLEKLLADIGKYTQELEPGTAEPQDGCGPDEVNRLVLAECPSLKRVSIASAGDMGELELHGCINLQTLSIGKAASLQTIDMRQCVELRTVEVHNCALLANIRVPEVPKLECLLLSGCWSFGRAPDGSQARTNVEAEQQTACHAAQELPKSTDRHNHRQCMSAEHHARVRAAHATHAARLHCAAGGALA